MIEVKTIFNGYLLKPNIAKALSVVSKEYAHLPEEQRNDLDNQGIQYLKNNPHVVNNILSGLRLNNG